MKIYMSCLTALSVVIALATPSFGQIVLVDEDFSTGPGIVVDGNSTGGGFTASGGVGILVGNGSDTFYSTGVENVTDPSLALGGQLTFEVDNLGGVANPVTRWLQLDVDNTNPFMGRSFGDTNEPLLLTHTDDAMTITTTIPVGTTELDLLFVTTVDFGGTPLPNGEIARLGSFFAEFTPNGPTVIKGDVDMSGTVDFGDIPPFISVLQSGVLQLEADCDCDGDVDFSDIPAFISILQAG